jgi:GDP-L-fucose synthase
MNLIVLGGTGFIGRNLVNSLANSKLKITATYHNKLPYDLNNKYITWKKIDLLDNFSTLKLLSKYDTIINCAAISSGASDIIKTPLMHLYKNLIINTNVAESINSLKEKKIIFISSSVVYPESSEKMKENNFINEFSEVYRSVGNMKAMSENILDLTLKYNINNKNKYIYILRPSNIYGPFDKFQEGLSKVIPALISRAIRTPNLLKVWGDGLDSRDFLYIDDFISAVKLVIFNKNNQFITTNNTNIYNVSSSTNFSINKIALIIQDLINNNQNIEYDSYGYSTIKIRKISNTKFKKTFNWKVETKLKDGLYKTINWYKRNNIC